MYLFTSLFTFLLYPYFIYILFAIKKYVLVYKKHMHMSIVSNRL